MSVDELWDRSTRGFRIGALEKALLVRGISPADARALIGIGESTYYKLLKGVPVSAKTFTAVLRVLEEHKPLAIAS